MIEDEDGSIQTETLGVATDIESTVAFTLLSEAVRLGHVSGDMLLHEWIKSD